MNPGSETSSEAFCRALRRASAVGGFIPRPFRVKSTCCTSSEYEYSRVALRFRTFSSVGRRNSLIISAVSGSGSDSRMPSSMRRFLTTLTCLSMSPSTTPSKEMVSSRSSPSKDIFTSADSIFVIIASLKSILGFVSGKSK